MVAAEGREVAGDIKPLLVARHGSHDPDPSASSPGRPGGAAGPQPGPPARAAPPQPGAAGRGAVPGVRGGKQGSGVVLQTINRRCFNNPTRAFSVIVKTSSINCLQH